MEIKGTGLITTRDYVRENHPNQYQSWLNSLPPQSKKLFEKAISASQWYPMYEGYVAPLNATVQMFFQNKPEGADQVGRYSADKALKGIYKTFLMIASPNFLMQRASRIFTTYYTPSEIEVGEKGKNHISLRINSFKDINKVLEYRIAGWVARALELTGCNEVSYQIPKSLVNYQDKHTEIEFTWK